MKLKKLDNILDRLLWVVFFVLVILSFYVTWSIKAPKLEYVESEKIPYVYTSNSGEKYNSYYLLAWQHKAFSRPQPVAADPNNGNVMTIKTEYIEEFKAKMPESKYPFYTRLTWLWFGLLVIISALLTYLGGGATRDLILYLKLKSHANFEDCAYFLHEDRIAFKESVKRLIAYNVGEYVKKKSDEIKTKYRPDFANLLIKILKDVAINSDTVVPYYLTYRNNTKDQKSYLAELRSFWDKRVGKDPKSEDIIRNINTLLENEYLSINLLLSESDVATAVSRQLDKLFVEILGGEVLKFEGYTLGKHNIFKPEGKLFIDINVTNHSNSFTWNGNAVPKGTCIPGVQVEFKIYHYVNQNQTILWNKYLVPRCHYTAKDSEFSTSELYKDMVISTIDSFNDKI